MSFWGEMELILEKIENKDIKPHVFLHSALLPCCFRERDEGYAMKTKNMEGQKKIHFSAFQVAAILFWGEMVVIGEENKPRKKIAKNRVALHSVSQ